MMKSFEREAQLTFLQGNLTDTDTPSVCEEFESFSGGYWTGTGVNKKYVLKDFEINVDWCASDYISIDTTRINGKGSPQWYFYPDGSTSIDFDTYGEVDPLTTKICKWLSQTLPNFPVSQCL